MSFVHMLTVHQFLDLDTAGVGRWRDKRCVYGHGSEMI